MRVCLIGPGNVTFHYHELLNFKEKELTNEIEGIAKALASSNSEIELLPDNGICIEIARKYKEFGGRKVIGSVPLSDNTFGISHLKKYMDEQVNGIKLFDELIDTENWYKQDMIKGLLGDVVLYLGSSPGTDGELNYAAYLYKIIGGKKEGVDVAGKRIHLDVRAGTEVPFTVLAYTPFISSKKLGKETEAYCKKLGITLVYVNNAGGLEKALKKLSK